MITTFLIRGMLVGFLASFLAFGFARVFAEPQIETAIAFQEAQEKAKGEDPEPELVSRTVQSSYGLLTAVVVYGSALGGLFALAYAVAYGRVGALSPRATALLVALGGFFILYLLPALKYPPNPPSVGLAETLGFRTTTYFLMILISAGIVAFSIWSRQRLVAGLGGWNASIIAGGIFIAITSTVILLLPDINEVPDAFSAVVLWRFRLASVGTQLILWTTLGLLFGALTERSLRKA